SYMLNRDFITEKLTESLSDATVNIVREVNLWRKERLYEVRIFASSYEVTENLDALLRGAAPPTRLAEARRRLTDYLASVQAKFRDYEELKVVDPSGRVLFTSARQAGTAVPTEWLAAARAEAAVLGEPHWDEAHRKGVLLVA